MSKQAVHQQLNRQIKQEKVQHHLLKAVDEIRVKHPTMAIRYLYYMIKPDHQQMMGRDLFEVFCKQHHLTRPRIPSYIKTTDSQGVIRFENLLMYQKPSRIDQYWQSDISYYQVNGIYYYLTFIVDAYTRHIVGHHTSKRLLTTHTTIPALQMAIKLRKKKRFDELVLHSDGGGQYYAKEFLRITQKRGIKNSMCKYPWENGKAERINGIIKNNYLRHRKIHNFEMLVKEVDRAVSLYNQEKPHIELNRMSPIAFEKKLLNLNQAIC
ncbi:transposase [Aquirufa ecclesiirivi]